MKKFLILIICALAANYAQAQKLNQDTLAKYSKKTEQAKVFNRVAADIQLNAAQTLKFNRVSGIYADKAIAIAKNTGSAPCYKLTLLKGVLKDYSAQLKQVLSPEQFTMLKGEREKYHFGRRFIDLAD